MNFSNTQSTSPKLKHSCTLGIAEIELVSITVGSKAAINEQKNIRGCLHSCLLEYALSSLVDSLTEVHFRIVISNPLIQEGGRPLEELRKVGLSTLRVPILETHHQVWEIVESPLEVLGLESDHHSPVMLVFGAGAHTNSHNPN